MTDMPLRWGKVFEAGTYATKDFSMTPEELRAAVAAFEPVPIDLEHRVTIFSGKLGTLQEVKLADDGRTLLGGVAEAPWLSTLLGNTVRKVSCTWDKATKHLLALAYTLDPHIEDAAIFSAQAAFAKADDRARVDELLAMTPLGQQVLRDRKAKEQAEADKLKAKHTLQPVVSHLSAQGQEYLKNWRKGS
ncbi:MAG: hypothetical protein H0X37_27455 [Herpetosiphonaceae bacterium]|nr:hypothetical protein [Herpetosiphonaceae bacterium]